MTNPLVLDLEKATVWLPGGERILDDITWQAREGEHWALLGPNGSGKSTLLSLSSAGRHPSSGTVTILGERMGRTSVWDLRERIGVVDPNQKTLEWATVLEVILTGVTNTVWPQPDRITDADRTRADWLLALLGCQSLRDRQFNTCSQGERQRVRIARALMAEPELLLLDEPATGLDLLAREALILAMSELAIAQPALATVVVSHHLEELPGSTTHAILLNRGRVVAAGPVETVLVDNAVSESFEFPVQIGRHNGRWTARAAASWSP